MKMPESAPPFSMICAMDAWTSAASKLDPSLKVTSSRSTSDHSFASSDDSHSVARLGTYSPSSITTSVSNSCLSTCMFPCDRLKLPNGSRLAIEAVGSPIVRFWSGASVTCRPVSSVELEHAEAREIVRTALRGWAWRWPAGRVVKDSWPWAEMGVVETPARTRTTSRDRAYGLAA